MDEIRAKVALSVGRTYMLLEASIQADIIETTRRVMRAAFGASLEFRLVQELASAVKPLTLTEIASRAGATRREMTPAGRLRATLLLLERSGMVINVGSRRKPLFQLNLLNDESKLLVTLFRRSPSSHVLPALPLEQ